MSDYIAFVVCSPKAAIRADKSFLGCSGELIGSECNENHQSLSAASTFHLQRSRKSPNLVAGNTRFGTGTDYAIWIFITALSVPPLEASGETAITLQSFNVNYRVLPRPYKRRP